MLSISSASLLKTLIQPFLHLVYVEVHVTLSVKNLGVILNVTLYELCQEQGASAVAGTGLQYFGKKLLVLFLLLLKMDLCLLELGLVLHNPLVEIVQEVLLVSLRRSLPDLDCLLFF